MPVLLQRSKLQYPGGNPQFDQSHVASEANMYSFVAGGTGGAPFMINAPGVSLRRAVITLTSPSTKIDGRIGPMSYNSAADSGLVKFTGFSTAAFTAVTIAAIARIDVDAGGTQIALADDSGGNDGATLVLFKVAVNSPQIRLGGTVVAPASPVALTLGVPYFVAFTGTPNVAGWWVMKNMITGAKFYGATGAFPATFTGGAGTLFIGNSNSTFANLAGGVAAGMRSNTSLMLPQLLSWADDPWEFWYPQSSSIIFESLSGPTGGATNLMPQIWM